MSTFVMSDKYPCFVKGIEQLGHKVISSDKINEFPIPEQKHADMQILPVNNDIFILNECTLLSKELHNKKLIFCSKKAGNKYPGNILLNFLYMNKKLYGKLSGIDKKLLDYCIANNIETVNVNQGYARCSTLVLNKFAAITSDLSIKKTLSDNGVEVLLISSGNIALDGYDYGFIGGASGKVDEKTIVFFGNVKNHPDYLKIRKFCIIHGLSIKIIGEEMPLTDIGGIVMV